MNCTNNNESNHRRSIRHLCVRLIPSVGHSISRFRVRCTPGTLFVLILCILLFISSSTAIVHPSHVQASPPHQTQPAGPPTFGVNAHLATRYPAPGTMDIPGSMLTELGVSWVREDFHWYRIQPQQDVWNWTFNDTAVRHLVRRDINVLGVIGGPSAPWATSYERDNASDASFYAPDTEAFVRYARAVVTRYHRYIDHWEIWNEPDNIHFWKPRPDPRAYANVLIRTSAAIKEIDPDATVLIGGFNPFDTTYIRTVIAAGAWDHFDILAIHPYVDPYSPEEGNIVGAVQNMRTLTEQYGDKPIWATEVGWSSGAGDHDPVGITDENEQASFLVRSLLLLWEAGVANSFWYTLKDDPGNPYGLVAYGTGRDDYSRRKPAFAAFRTLNEQLRGATFVQRRDLFQHHILMRFASTQDTWVRPVQPNGILRSTSIGAAQIRYNFTTTGNDYVAFECQQSIPLRQDTYALGIWVYGDGSGHGVQMWVRDAEGEVLQFRPGVVGTPGWQFLSTPIVGPVELGNRIAGSGNGRVDFPASFTALVLDDTHDVYTGTGTVYMDNLTMITGREVHDLRFDRDGKLLDILWSPPGTRVSFKSAAPSGILVERDGRKQSVVAEGGRFALVVRAEPVYMWH